MSDATPDDEFARAAGDLADSLRELRGDVEPRRGPLGLPRPPRPDELLRFADEAAIPALVAVLEANVRALEALQRAIRLARRGEDARQQGGEARDRAADLSRATLQRVDSALEEFQRAVESGGLPDDSPAAPVLEDARELRREIDRRLRDATAEERTLDEFEDEDSGKGVNVDVDAELDSLRDQYREDGDEDEGGDGNGGGGAGDT
ncbi:DUF7547 family protein [Halostella litorea]|uniref:DUF7547 family protein n=1 Tax=Halostella litorea TaxID=2528831 RepID=UPI001093268D|nr:hypothetical protein [Halostella litorea]